MNKPLAGTAILAAASIALGAFLVPAARGQEARSGGGAVSAQMVAELQQLSTENTSLKSDNAQLKQQLAAMQTERDSLKKGAAATGARVKSSEAALARSNAQEAASEQKIGQLQAGMQQLIAKFRDLAAALRKVEIEDATTKQTLALRQRDLDTCSQRNQALYELDDDVLTHFERQGFLARLAQDEPFTQIKRTQLHNFAIESRQSADDQRYVPPAAKP